MESIDGILWRLERSAEVFRGRLETDREVLLKWAARDRDRTMLFGAELEIDVDR